MKAGLGKAKKFGVETIRFVFMRLCVCVCVCVCVCARAFLRASMFVSSDRCVSSSCSFMQLKTESRLAKGGKVRRRNNTLCVHASVCVRVCVCARAFLRASMFVSSDRITATVLLFGIVTMRWN